MSTSEGPVDFESVRINAEKQGIDLQQVTIFYEELSDEQVEAMTSEGLITHGARSGTASAHFRADGSVAFPEKATAVLYLGAD